MDVVESAKRAVFSTCLNPTLPISSISVSTHRHILYCFEYRYRCPLMVKLFGGSPASGSQLKRDKISTWLRWCRFCSTCCSTCRDQAVRDAQSTAVPSRLEHRSSWSPKNASPVPGDGASHSCRQSFNPSIKTERLRCSIYSMMQQLYCT